MKQYKNTSASVIKKIGYYGYPFILVILLMTISYKLYGYAPFGSNSLAWKDADIQYLDFFAYLKDVLTGRNNISYTFGKSLGGSNIAVFSYYLASPLNLLVIFFKKTELHTFFDLLVAIKLGLAAVTIKVFICNRFSQKEFNKSQEIIVFLLSVSYALSQYTLAQSSNVMWLDGVYMLPLILLGVYKCINEKNDILLSVTVGVSILVNWYTGGINCIFSGMWLILELLLSYMENDDKKGTMCIVIKKFFQYIVSMLIGVGLSAVLFLPTIGALENNAKGSLNWKSLFNISFLGHIGSAIQGYSLGAKSDYGMVSLFCGSLVIIGCISIFISKKIEKKIKVLFAFAVAVILLCFYWKPLYALFSMFKSVDSYWYRYSYIGIFTLIFIAAYFYEKYFKIKERNILIISGTAFALVLLVLDYIKPIENLNYIQYSAIFVFLIACILELYPYGGKNKYKKILSNIGILLLVVTELFVEIKLEMNSYHVSNVDTYRKYTAEAQQQINALKSLDNTTYRISQTSARAAANYNEALAYNYSSISSYTSSPDDISRKFLDKIGYKSEADCINVIQTSIIGADSFLGVKYILSAYDIDGYEKMGEIEKCNGKNVYKNPFALPMAFTYPNIQKNTQEKNINKNIFEYQNDLYSELLGENIELYIPVEYSISEKTEESVNYKLKILNGRYAYYGNLVCDSKDWAEVLVNVNNEYEMEYSCWLSPSVFYIPYEDNDSINIEMSGKRISEFEDGNQQFYALDLKKFAEVTKKLQNCAADKIVINNGKAEFEVTNKNTEKMCITIPYDTGWKICVNDKEVIPELIADSFYSIKLLPGTNRIVMSYRIKYFHEGVGISIFSLVIVITMFILKKRDKKIRRL